MRGWYQGLVLPPGVPTESVFGLAGAILYVVIGLAAWLVWQRGRSGPLQRSRAARGLRLWGWQLLLNASWVPAFFGLRSPALGLAIVLPMLALAAATSVSFAQIRREASLLMVPYVLWTCYVAYLNAGVVWLNPPA